MELVETILDANWNEIVLRTPRDKALARERLGKLAELLRSVPRSKFDMQHWGEMEDKKAQRVVGPTLPPIVHCGTTCCAAGHASLDPWFRRRGFKGEWHVDEYGCGRDKFVSLNITFGKYGICNFETCQAFFRLSPDEANAIFGQEWDRSRRRRHTPKSKARQIERFIQEVLT